MADGTRRPAVVRDLGDGHVGLWVAYDDRHEAKRIATARWDPSLKCWRIHHLFRRDAEELVARLNRALATAAGASVTTITASVTSVFTVIPDYLKQPTYKALAGAWHPDRGGDTAVMQALNASWAEVRP